MSSPTSQEPRVLSTTELDAKDAKWVTLNVLDWQDEDGKKVSDSVFEDLERDEQ